MTDEEQSLPSFKIVELIEEIPDPRLIRCQKHSLISIVFITLVTGLCGANNWVEVESMGEALHSWIESYVPLPNGIPSHDTFGRVFSIISPKAFRSFFEKWISFIRDRLKREVVNFDGKTLRRTKGQEGPLHLLNAWSVDNRICLGQLPVDKKTNEITVFPELIKLLELKGCIITADALNTQKDIAQAIVEAEADYILPVKGNHAGLREDIELFFKDALERSFQGIDADNYRTLDKDHGRLDSRQYYVIDADSLPEKNLWKGLKSLGMEVRERCVQGKQEQETTYYLMSTEIDAKLLERCVRGHWAVENSLHWRLDVIFREDESRYREKIGAENLSLVRKMALGALSKDKSVKGGIQSKRLRAAASSKYREYILKNLL